MTDTERPPPFTVRDLPRLSFELRNAESQLAIDERRVDSRRETIAWLREQIASVAKSGDGSE